MNSIAIYLDFGLLKKQCKFALAILLIASTFFISSCANIEALFAGETPKVVQSQTAGVVSATRLFVLGLGPAAETSLNAYILAINGAVAKLIDVITKGQSILPTPAQLTAQLAALAASIGNPVWAQNFAGNLVFTYNRFYASIIAAGTPTILAYLNAFELGTV